MSEEKSLFVEKELNRWKRPESPRPGTALVFIGDGRTSLIVYEGERGPTQGELLFGKYSTYYEVDMGDRSLNFNEKLPCADAFEFHAEVKLTYAVSDPALVLRRARADAGQFLKDLAIDAMRRASRRYKHEQTGEAENAISGRIEEEVRDNGFKLSRPAFVKLSLDEAVHTRLINRKLGEYDFQDKETEVSRQGKLDELEEENKQRLKKKKAEFYAPLIQAGDWATLLAMLDINDPDDITLKVQIETIQNQKRLQDERQIEMLKVFIDKGAVESWEFGEATKELIKKVGGLSDQSMARLEGSPESQGSEDPQRTKDVKSPVPDEISRDQDDESMLG